MEKQFQGFTDTINPKQGAQKWNPAVTAQRAVPRDTDFFYLPDPGDPASVRPKYRLSTWQTGYQWQVLDSFSGDWHTCLDTSPDAVIGKGVEFNDISTFCRIENTVPRELRLKLAPFTHKPFTLRHLVARNFRILDLLDSPALLCMVLGWAGSKRLWLDRAADLVMRPRHEILGEISGIPEKWAVKVLSRLTFTSWDYRTLRRLRSVAASRQQLQILRNLPLKMIRGNFFIDFIQKYTEFAGSRIFVEMLISRSITEDSINEKEIGAFLESGYLHIYNDTIRLGQALEIAGVERIVQNLPSFKAVSRLHDQWNRQLEDREFSADAVMKRYGATSFPKPPIPGNEDIVPITSIEELREEGREMHHCVYNAYADNILQGHFFAYRVLRPERATLGIEIRDSGATLGLSEFRLVQNGDPSLRSKRKAALWFYSFVKNREERLRRRKQQREEKEPARPDISGWEDDLVHENRTAGDDKVQHDDTGEN